MPAGEQFADLARHGATMAIHLGVRHLARIVDELRPYYGDDCPIAVVYRASWPDEERVVGTLVDIVGKVERTDIARTALILVGRVLAAEQFDESTLYAPD
jgi:precorrin-4/cobalt-precorrin-4 C11-methyltransferase